MREKAVGTKEKPRDIQKLANEFGLRKVKFSGTGTYIPPPGDAVVEVDGQLYGIEEEKGA